jgi:hypothetical protein
MLVMVALVGGTLIGAWSAMLIARRSLDSRLRRVAEDLRQKHAATADQLRAAQVRAQSELEQLRTSVKRQVASASEEPRAAAARAEERLKAAYAEIDRLRSAATSMPDSLTSELSDGFAATRPMREGL